jgi:O-antigen/teichoic acid export membrane protein
VTSTRISLWRARSLRRADFGRPAGIAALGKAFEIASLCLLVTVVPRALGPGDYGVFAVATSIVTIGSATLALGGPVLMGRFVPTAPEYDRPALARALAARTARWRGGLLALAGVVVAVIAAARPGTLPLVPTALVLSALCVDAAATVLLQMTFALQRVVAWSLRYPLQNLTLVVGVLVLGTTLGEAGILAAILLSTLAALAVGIAATRRMGPAAPRWCRPLPDGVTRFATLQGLGSGAMVLGQRGGILAVALLGSATDETGFAALAIGISLALCFAGVQPFVAELPRLVELSASDSERAEREVRRLGWIALGALGLAAILTAAVGDQILRLAGGHAYEGAQDALVVALAAVPFAAALGVLTVTSALRLRIEARLLSLGAGLVATVVGSLLLVPHHAAVGGAAAFTAGAIATGMVACALLPTGVRPSFVAACALAACVVVCVGVVV